jgi:hypothetical protein
MYVNTNITIEQNNRESMSVSNIIKTVTKHVQLFDKEKTRTTITNYMISPLESPSPAISSPLFLILIVYQYKMTEVIAKDNATVF